MKISDISVPQEHKKLDNHLTKAQFDELSDFLGCSPNDYGEWRLIPSCRYPTCVNDLGTAVIRFSCSYVTSDGQHRNKSTFSYNFSTKHGGYVHTGLGYLHRLVAEAFLDTWDPKLTVNHIDGNKLNNHPNNLEMVTQTENMKHFYNADCFIESRKLRNERAKQGMIEHYKCTNHKSLGKKWVHKGNKSLLVLAVDLPSLLSQGYELGPYISDELHRKLVSNDIGNSYAKGSIRSQEFKDALSVRMKGNQYALGRHHSDEAKKRISDARKGVPKSEECKRKLSESHKGRILGPASDSTKANISKSKRGRIWVHSIVTKEMTQIYPEQLDEYMSKGFVRGMK